MAIEEHDWDSEWRDLEPQQPGSGRCGCWLGVAVLMLALCGTCLGTTYFAWQQLGLPMEPGAIFGRPTIPSPASLPSTDVEIPATAESGAMDEQPSLAPTVTLPGDGSMSSVEEVAVRLMASAPSIDGNLSEWEDIPGVDSTHLVFTAESWDGTDDIRAFWRLGWDQINLYAAVLVEDDIHVQTEQGSTIFKGDGVSLQLDTQRVADYAPRLSPDDFQINISPGDFAGNPPMAHRFRGDSNGNLADFLGHGIQVAALPTPGGYSIEAAIPWRDIEVSPAVDFVMGIALNVNDNDTPGTAVQEMMKSSVPGRKFSDPTSWGTLTLR